MLHSTPLLGNLTDPWIDLQSRSFLQLPSRLLGLEAAAGAERRQHWLVAGDRPDLWLAYKAMFRSGGLSLRWLAGRFRRNPPAAVHAHYGPVAAQHRHLARAVGSPLVASFYGYDATEVRFTQRRLWRGRYARLFAEMGAVIVEGPKMASRVEALGCPPEKIEVIRMPADSDALSRCNRPSDDRFTVSLAGRFIEKKGFDLGIRAFSAAFRGRRDAHLVIVGGGELESELRRTAAEERVESQVTWGGRLPFKEFMEAATAAKLGMYPSRTASNGDSEGGAPVTLIEAQWLGLPSLVSDHDDLPFVAAPKGSIVLPATALEAWVETLRELFDSPSRIDAMSSAARSFARQHHSPERNTEARESVYAAVSRSA